MKHKLIKIIIMILLILSLFAIVIIDKNGNGFTMYDINNIKSNRKLKEKEFNIIINNVSAIYDNNEKVYYYNIPKEYENKKYSLSIKLDNGYKYKINNQFTNTIIVNYSNDVNLTVYNDKYYYELKLRLTNLPIVSINTDNNSNITDTKIKSIFKYINNSNLDSEISYNNVINIRGNTSKHFKKSSYRVNFLDKNFEDNEKINITNFYNGDSLILESLYSDPSRIRNKLQTDLWNEVINDVTNIDLYSEFVEVIVNNEYKGLYVLSEPINRTKLELDKTNNNDTSIIIKGINYKGFLKEIPANYSDSTYEMFEIKYPNDSNYYNKIWNNIIPNLYNYYHISPKTYDSITNVFDLNNYIDLLLFNDFTYNVDNAVKKNNYFYKNSINDSTFYIMPWDMDMSYGLTFDSSSSTMTINKHYNYNKSILTSYKSTRITSALKSRYSELRKTIFTEEYLYDLIDKYYEEIKYAAKRDSDAWYELDLNQDIKDIKEFIHNRIIYYDEFIETL